MNTIPNPFLRGYSQFNIKRVLLVTSEDDGRLYYRSVHSLQAHIPDSQLEHACCEFGSDFALIPERLKLPEPEMSRCPHTGFVLTVLWSITADQGGVWVHVGDAHSAEAAQEVVRQLSFNTGHYSRCWEVSSKHLAPLAMRWLERCAAGSQSSAGVLFSAFGIPGTRGAVGCVLHATPWTDEHLRAVQGIDSRLLRELQERGHMPVSLMSVLHQAALADTRILIFDPDAPALAGLLLHD